MLISRVFSLALYRRERETGQALVMTLVGFVFVMGILGLVVDVGWGYFRREVAQAAADSAALAAVGRASDAGGPITCGAGGIVCQGSTSCSSATAGTNFKTACQYGVQNGVANADLSIAAGTSTPVSGVAVSYWVTATVREPLGLTFLSAMGFHSATVAASATAASIGIGDGCIYVLDPTANQAFVMNGSAVTTGCGVYIDSNSTTNAFFGNGSSLSVGSSSLNMVIGAGEVCNGCGSYPASPNRGAAVGDPLASVPAPTFSGCDQTNYLYNGNGIAPTLTPGVYCGGIRLNGSGTVNFNPGMYILNGGGLTINGSQSVTANGVFFYNTSAGYPSGPLLINGSGTEVFTPETAGVYQGIVFYQDHHVCSSAINAINGGNKLLYTGTLYLHCTNTSYVPDTIVYNGVENPSYYQGLVVDKIQFNGVAKFYQDPTNGGNTGIGLSTKAYLIQ
jgi:hypothetical protein